MARIKFRSLVLGLAASSMLLAVLDASAAPVSQHRAMPTASTQQAPSERDVLDVLRLLPGVPKDWRFPRSVARSVSYKRATIDYPVMTHAVVLETDASVEAVRAFYDAAIEHTGAERREAPERAGRIVLAFRGGSVTIGHERGVTFIVLVAEQQPVASAPPN